jgi:hypothetical protein
VAQITHIIPSGCNREVFVLCNDNLWLLQYNGKPDPHVLDNEPEYEWLKIEAPE